MSMRRSFRWMSPLVALVMVLTAMSAAPYSAPTLAFQSASDTLIQPRGDAGLSGTMPGAGPLNVPEVLWQAPTGDIIMGMAVRGDQLAFTTKAGSQGALQVVDRATGEEQWLVEFGGAAIVFGPAATENLFVVSVWEGDDGTAVVALDAASGDEAWRVDVDSYPVAPTYLDGVVYVPTEGGLDQDSAMVALDAESGDELWRYDAPEALNLGERVAVADGVVVASASSLEENGIGAYAFDAETGDILWTFTERDDFTFDPVVGDGIALLTNLPSIWGVDLKTGEILWSGSVGGGVGGGVALVDGIAYYGLEDEVRAVDAATGEEIWSSPVTRIAGAPIVGDGIVYTAVWRPSDESEPHFLHALDAESGEEVWQLALESRVNGNQPLAVDGVMFVDTSSGVVAFSTEGGSTPDAPVTGAGGAYQSEVFGYEVAWAAPWSWNEGQSTTDDDQDFLTLEVGQVSVSIITRTLSLDADETLDAIIARRDSEVDDLEVVESDGNAEFANATVTFTKNDVPRTEYLEVHMLDEGLVQMVTLSAPQERFSLIFAMTVSTITLDGEPVFTAEPAAQSATLAASSLTVRLSTR